MAFNSTIGRAEYTAGAGQTVFPFSFKLFFDGDIKVYLTPVGQASDDSTDILILDTDYTVALSGDLGGSITLISAASNGDAVTLLRKLDIDRLIEYQTSGDLLASTLNSDQDYQTYLIADREADAGSHVRLPDSAQNVSVVLESPPPDAYIKWNAAGNELENDTSIPENVTNTELYKWEAEASKLTSESYATEAEDVFVKLYTSDGDGTFTIINSSEYSSFHYSEKAESQAADAGQLEAWGAEAERMTSDSYATEPEDVFVKTYTSDGDGTFTAADTTEYSSLHWAAKSSGSSLPAPSFPADEGLALVARATGNDWEKILGLPLETGHEGMSVSNHGTEGDSYWSSVNKNPNVLNGNETIESGVSASVVTGFEIPDGLTLEIADGSVMSVV